MIVINQRLCFGLLFLAIVLTIVLTRPDHKEREIALENMDRDRESSFHQNGSINSAAIPSHEEIRFLRYTLERDGAMAEVVVNATDRRGNPIQGASVRLYFNQPKGTDKAKGVVEGFTDSSGRFAAKKKTTYACHWKIEKEGFYRASGILPFSNHFSFTLGKEKRWTASPLQVDAILDKRSDAKLLHGFIGIMDLPLPTNTWAGFDFEANDLVKPHGKGIHPHISFYSVGTGKPRDARLAGIVWTNQLYIAAEGGGMSLLQQRKNTDMPFCLEAPETFQSETLELFSTRSRQGMMENREMKKEDFIVFQTADSGNSTGKPHFGIIRNLEYWPGGIRMEYFFNLVPGDRRTDADIHSEWNLKR